MLEPCLHSSGLTRHVTARACFSGAVAPWISALLDLPITFLLTRDLLSVKTWTCHVESLWESKNYYVSSFYVVNNHCYSKNLHRIYNQQIQQDCCIYRVGGFNPFEKCARQIGSSPQGSGYKLKNWNHHLVTVLDFQETLEFYFGTFFVAGFFL